MSRWEGGTRLHAADVVRWDDCAALGTVGALAPHIPTEWVLVRAAQHGGVVGSDTTGGEGGGGVEEVVLEGEGGGAAFRGVTHEGQPLLPIAVSRTGATEVANHRNTWAEGRRRGGEGRGGCGEGSGTNVQMGTNVRANPAYPSVDISTGLHKLHANTSVFNGLYVWLSVCVGTCTTSYIVSPHPHLPTPSPPHPSPPLIPHILTSLHPHPHLSSPPHLYPSLPSPPSPPLTSPHPHLPAPSPPCPLTLL